MLEAESRLYDLSIFDWSSVGPRKPITDQTDEMALVKVHEAKRNEITYGFGFEVSHRGGNIPTGTVALPGGGGSIGLGGHQIAPSQSTFASPRGSVEFNRRNMRGLGETASASILLSRLDQRALTTYSQPHFIGSQWHSLYQLFAGTQQRESSLHCRPGRPYLSGGTRHQPQVEHSRCSSATTSTRPASRICSFPNSC